MSSNNNNLDGSSGVQQPKRKRKNHKDHSQWSRHRWENILKTNMDADPSHGALVTYQAQQEPQKVQGSHSCDLPLCLSTKFDKPHSNVSSAVGAGITYQPEKESVEGSSNCNLSLGLPVEVDISHSIVSSAVFVNTALSNEETAKADTSPLAGVFPANPSIGNIETPEVVAPANRAPHFSSMHNSQFSSFQSSLRKAAETPSIFRKQKHEQLSERKTVEADTCALEKLRVGAGSSSGDPKLNSVSRFPLEPDLQTLKGNPISAHGSPSGLGLRSERGLPPVDNHGFLLLLSVCQDEGWLQKDNTLQNPFQRPEPPSIVSSKVPSPAFTDSVHQQSSKMQLVPSLKGKEQLLDLDRKSVHCNFRSAFTEEGVDISGFEILKGFGSTKPSSRVTPFRSESERGSPSTHVTLSREASKKVSPSTRATSSRAGSKKVSPSTSATPPRAASKQILPSASGTPPRAASQKVSPSTHVTRSEYTTTPALGTLSQQKRRSSSRNNRLSNQIEGPSTQNELPSNQNEGASHENNQPSDQMRRRSNPSRIPSNQDRRPSVSSRRVKSAFKGVSLFKRTGRFEAHFWNTAERRQEYLGSFSTEEQAARAYDRATLFFRGVSSELHFQLDDYAGELPQLVALTKDQLLSMLKEQGHKEGSRYPTYPS